MFSLTEKLRADSSIFIIVVMWTMLLIKHIETPILAHGMTVTVLVNAKKGCVVEANEAKWNINIFITLD